MQPQRRARRPDGFTARQRGEIFAHRRAANGADERVVVVSKAAEGFGAWVCVRSERIGENAFAQLLAAGARDGAVRHGAEERPCAVERFAQRAQRGDLRMIRPGGTVESFIHAFAAVSDHAGMFSCAANGLCSLFSVERQHGPAQKAARVKQLEQRFVGHAVHAQAVQPARAQRVQTPHERGKPDGRVAAPFRAAQEHPLPVHVRLHRRACGEFDLAKARFDHAVVADKPRAQHGQPQQNGGVFLSRPPSLRHGDDHPPHDFHRRAAQCERLLLAGEHLALIYGGEPQRIPPRHVRRKRRAELGQPAAVLHCGAGVAIGDFQLVHTLRGQSAVYADQRAPRRALGQMRRKAQTDFRAFIVIRKSGDFLFPVALPETPRVRAVDKKRPFAAHAARAQKHALAPGRQRKAAAKRPFAPRRPFAAQRVQPRLGRFNYFCRAKRGGEAPRHLRGRFKPRAAPDKSLRLFGHGDTPFLYIHMPEDMRICVGKRGER